MSAARSSSRPVRTGPGRSATRARDTPATAGPASVVLIDLSGPLAGDATDRVARRLADAIRGEARETDRAVRIGALSFRVLLPETGGRAARRFAERLDTTFRTRSAGEAGTERVDLCVEIATPARTASLEDALAEAETRLQARSVGGQTR